MTEPMTVNVGLIVPNTGDLVGTWGSAAVNPDFVALDGLFGGVQTISVSNVNVTLTSPAGFIPTPGGGPTQSQNRVLRFTGALSGNVVVTLPLPGSYIVENRTTGNFLLSFISGTSPTEGVTAPPGETIEIYTDGSVVRFVNLARVGAMEMWAGISTIPAWVAGCSIRPYLLCDGSIFNVSDFPYLGARLGNTFGGNGITTFGVPDMQGRVPLAYDGTGVRITSVGCGINGQQIGAFGGVQNNTLAANQIPSITSVNASQSISVTSADTVPRNYLSNTVGTPGTGTPVSFPTGNSIGTTVSNGVNSISVAYTNASQQAVINVQPATVTGIWVVKT